MSVFGIIRVVLEYKALKGKKKVEQLFMHGRFYSGKRISLKAWQVPGAAKESTQWAVCVSRKLGKAVVRNRYRRLCKENLRRLRLSVRPGCYIALLPRNGFIGLKFSEQGQALSSLLKRAGLLVKSPGEAAH